MIDSEVGWHGGKAAIQRPRVRQRGGAELKLPSWIAIQKADLLSRWAFVWQDWRSMLAIGTADIRDIWRSTWRAPGGRGAPPARPGKYEPLQKFYHLGVAILILAVVASGLLMLLKIDTPLWRRDPYWFSNDTWGITTPCTVSPPWLSLLKIRLGA